MTGFLAPLAELPIVMNTPEKHKDRDALKPLERNFANVISPFQEFIRDQKVTSLLLLACTIIAIIIANSDLYPVYVNFLETNAGIVFGSDNYVMNIHHWINKGIMALFFFVLGLEIKRELLVGDLRNPRNSVPVVAAALGGMLFPAMIYYAINHGQATVQGWAIPMATDTAFAIGLLGLLGRRVPQGLTSFILALAIIDDIGAVLVIAFYYSENISTLHIYITIALMVLLFTGNRLGIRHSIFYLGLGILVWLAVLGSGIHTTVAGVLVALTVPARPVRTGYGFLRRSRELLNRFQRNYEHKEKESTVLANTNQYEIVENLHKTVKDVTTPLQHWEGRLDYPVTLLVLPLFALANAGITLSYDSLSSLTGQPLAWGIFFGLVCGKLLGISLGTLLVTGLGLGELPRGVTLRHIPGLAFIGGIGFTMSVFIADLGFGNSPLLLHGAKASIIFASVTAGVIGFTWLYLVGRNKDPFEEAGEAKNGNSP